MMVGENPGQNQPATTTLAVIEQGMKVFTAIYKRIYRSLKKEYKKLYELNARYLPLEAYFVVLDPEQETVARIGQSDYDLTTMDVVPAADPNVITQAQRLAKAQALFELIQLGTVNPQEVTLRMLEAQEQPGIQRLMQMPPPQPNPEVVMEQQKMQQEYELELRKLAIEEAKVFAQLDRDTFERDFKTFQATISQRAQDLEEERLEAEKKEPGNQYDEEPVTGTS